MHKGCILIHLYLYTIKTFEQGVAQRYECRGIGQFHTHVHTLGGLGVEPHEQARYMGLPTSTSITIPMGIFSALSSAVSMPMRSAILITILTMPCAAAPCHGCKGLIYHHSSYIINLYYSFCSVSHTFH